MTIVKNLVEYHPFFLKDLEGSYEVLQRHKYFWPIYFWQWNDVPFKNWNLHRNAFSLFIFSKWKKYHSLTFEDTFKMYFVNYSNLTSSSIKKLFLNHGPLNVLFRFSRLLIYVYFIETFVKDFMKKLSFCNINF